MHCLLMNQYFNSNYNIIELKLLTRPGHTRGKMYKAHDFMSLVTIDQRKGHVCHSTLSGWTPREMQITIEPIVNYFSRVCCVQKYEWMQQYPSTL